MAGSRVVKRVVLALVILLLALAGIVFTFPFWFGPVLRPAAERFGVTFSKYEKLGDGRFALTEVVRSNRWFDLRIARVEGFRPEVWYRRAKETGTNAPVEFLNVNGWRVVVHPVAKSAERKPGTTNRTTYAEWKRIEHYIEVARRWAPKATLLNGIVEFKGREYTFPVITWEQGKLDASGVWPISAVPLEIKAKLDGKAPYQISYAMTPLDFRLRLQVSETNELLNTKLTGFYKDNRADLNASFAHEGLLPETATLKAPELKIPASLLKLKGYEDLTGSASGEWKTNGYTFSLKAHGEPFAARPELPPADIAVKLSGTTNSLVIQNASSTAPGLQLTISEPVTMDYHGKLLSDHAEMKIDADLAKIPWLKSSGVLKGTIVLEKGSKFPLATIEAEGSGVQARKIAIDHLELKARLNWPELEKFSMTAKLQSNSVVEVSGSANLQTRTLGETTITAEGPIATNALPSRVQFSGIKLSAKVSGPVTNLAHEGSCELRDFQAPQLNPVHLEVLWKAREIAFEQLALRARAGPATLWLAGSGYAENGKTNFILRELRLSKGDEPYLSLNGSANVMVTSAPGGGSKIELSPIHLAGTNKSLVFGGETSWPRQGSFNFEARQVNPDLFQAFVRRSLRGLDLSELNLAARWSNGPLYGKLTGDLSVAEENFTRLGARVNLELDENGLVLTRLDVRDPKGRIAEAKGFLPVSIHPLEAKRIHLSRRDQIDFELATATNAPFWSTIGHLAKVDLTNAAVQLKVHGTTRRPTGDFHFAADGLRLRRTNRELPAIGPVEGHLTLNEQVLRIPELSARISGQPVHVTGFMPLGENFWTRRREEILRYTLDHADVTVDAPEVQLAPFTVYLPKYLTPQGKLAVNAEWKPGRNLGGRIQMAGVETRPIARVGVVQDIRADVRLDGKTLAIQDFSGVLGGQRMTVSGNVNVAPESLAKGYPDVDLKITGKNLPLARNPDVILRSDLDLRVRNGTNQIPVITGDATLRDSFLLRDISTLVPGRVASPKKRPPYFSIEQEPIDEWRLHVRAHGENFMRVRSPFFQGVVSANFLVNGTMREPVALGDASITSGSVIFPFATLDVRQAIVSMTSEDPYVPHVFALATGRAFGFDIRMEAEGPANQPVLQFSSVPALSSEQIILMITTGQIPRQDFGFSTQDRASKLAFFLGKSLWAKLHPGKPAEEKLTIRSGEDITEQGRQTYEVEYKLNDRWSLVGEYDRFGGVNANVKWKLFSR